jgi:hypothetical protein
VGVSNWKQIALVVGASFTLVAPLVVGLQTGNTSLAVVVAACGAFVAMLARLDDLVELSLGPVKAKMLATLQEANATVDQLRALAVVSAAAQLASLSEAFFGWANGNRARLVHLAGEIIDSLRQLGVSEAEIATAVDPWRRSMSCVYHRYVKAYVSRADRRPGVTFSEPAQAAALAELKSAMDFDTRSAASPAKLREILARHGMLTDDMREWLDDYDVFLDTGAIRRPAVFGDR